MYVNQKKNRSIVCDGIRYGLQIKPESKDCEEKVVEEEVGA